MIASARCVFTASIVALSMIGLLAAGPVTDANGRPPTATASSAVRCPQRLTDGVEIAYDIRATGFPRRYACATIVHVPEMWMYNNSVSLFRDWTCHDPGGWYGYGGVYRNRVVCRTDSRPRWVVRFKIRGTAGT